MKEVPKHLQSYTTHDPRSQKEILKEYKASLTPKQKSEMREKKKKEKDQDKRFAESEKKSKAAMQRRKKEHSIVKTLVFPGYRKKK